MLILFLLKIPEKLTLYVWSDNINIVQSSDTDDIIREIFRSFLCNYQEELKIIKGSNFVFESADIMDYKLHRVHLRRGGSYIKSPEWLANKKGTINPKNKDDDECLRWSTIYALNYNEITKEIQPSEFTKAFSIWHHGADINKKLQQQNFVDTDFHAYEDNKMFLHRTAQVLLLKY